MRFVIIICTTLAFLAAPAREKVGEASSSVVVETVVAPVQEAVRAAAEVPPIPPGTYTTDTWIEERVYAAVMRFVPTGTSADVIDAIVRAVIGRIAIPTVSPVETADRAMTAWYDLAFPWGSYLWELTVMGRIKTERGEDVSAIKADFDLAVRQWISYGEGE